MQCPNCPQVALVMAERHGVEIDYCPHCRGVWLDRGELDKILDRAVTPIAQPQTTTSPFNTHPAKHHPQHPQYPQHKSEYDRQHKRKSWLSDLLDFD